MTKANESESIPFHLRFNIQLEKQDVEVRFINRVKNLIFTDFIDRREIPTKRSIYINIATALGEKYKYSKIDSYISRDFYVCLRAIEAAYAAVPAGMKKAFDIRMYKILDESEIDLGISWNNGVFIRTGAALLDQKLVSDPLGWLSESRYHEVYVPFEKGLSSFLTVDKDPKFLPDVIRDMYEALEALSKIVTERLNKDLSANAELFIKRIEATEIHRKILKDYIDYANRFRHAPREGKAKPILSISEVEFFIYLTGLFIRLAIGNKTINNLSPESSEDI